MIKNNQKIYAFIDSQNLNLGVKNSIVDKKRKINYQGWTVDFRKFYIYLKEKLKVEKAFIFIGFIEDNQPLYDNLISSGYTLIYKPTLEHTENGKTIVKGNVDAELVLHAMIEYNNYDKAVIVSGDGDYHCLVEYLDQQNKLLKICVPNRHSHSSLLRLYRKYFLFISDLKNKLAYKNKKRGSSLKTEL